MGSTPTRLADCCSSTWRAVARTRGPADHATCVADRVEVGATAGGAAVQADVRVAAGGGSHFELSDIEVTSGSYAGTGNGTSAHTRQDTSSYGSFQLPTAPNRTKDY